MDPVLKTTVRLAAIALLGLVALAGWLLLPGRRAEVRLPSVADTQILRTALATEPIYLQKDPRWADERIGVSGEPLRRTGSTVCCLSMALAHHGIVRGKDDATSNPDAGPTGERS